MLSKLTTSKAYFSTETAFKHAAKSEGRLNIFEASKIDGSGLPRAPKSAFRKRPVRLTYDKNEFWTFRMPSEEEFLMQNFDKQSLFGTRHGLQHSPHIKAQMDIDTRLLLGLCGVTALMLITEFKKNGLFCNLRENFRTVTYGRFEADDFIVKKQ